MQAPQHDLYVSWYRIHLLEFSNHFREGGTSLLNIIIIDLMTNEINIIYLICPVVSHISHTDVLRNSNIMFFFSQANPQM